MSHARTELRAAVRVALTTAMPDVAWPPAWWTKFAADELPVGAVLTPRTRTRRIDIDDVDRTVDLLVMLRRTGGADLEDRLDADSLLIEPAVMAVLDQHSDDYDLAEESADIDPNAELPLGTISMRFRVVLRTPEGAPE